MGSTRIVRRAVTFSELEARLHAYEARYGVPTDDLESAFTDVEDENMHMWASLRRVHREGIRRRQERQ